MREKIVQYALGMFFVLLPLQTVWLWREPLIGGAKWQYGTIGVYVTDIVLITVLCVGIAMQMKKPRLVRFLPEKFFDKCALLWAEKTHENCHGIFSRPPLKTFIPKSFNGKKTHKPWLYLILIAFVLWAGTSMLWAEDRVLAGYFFFKLVLAAGVFWLAQSWDVLRNRKVFGLFLLVAIMESALGIWQFLSQSSFASTLLGMSEYESWRAGVSVLKNESGRWLRAYGTFPHPNMLGAYLGAILVMAVSGWILSNPAEESFSRRKSFSLFVFWAVILLLGLLLSFSRAAWLGVVVSLTVLAAKVWGRGGYELKYRLVKVLGVIGIAATVFGGVLHEVVFPRFDGETIEREASVTDRALLMRQAEEIIQEHLVLGVGAGNYTLAVMQQHPELPVWEVQPVHNVFLLVLADLGLVGGVLFVVFLGMVVWAGLKDLFQKNQTESAIFFLALLSFIPSLFLDHFFWTSHFGLLSLFVFLGFMMKRVKLS
jgi:hypothetical protein